ncbi:Hypothetical predicted protein [Cloeon dipterum]|uniref:L-aminoadipate-semialdehyde dehydrogenase-phosphopantetheinyl transferase n=1 Tax=Cloeon dipterum TaxID=197152 RepID=A0A8S1C7H2_9INSE|nr:Hypothetical predicted protein [Cloeon dipterum]
MERMEREVWRARCFSSVKAAFPPPRSDQTGMASAMGRRAHLGMSLVCGSCKQRFHSVLDLQRHRSFSLCTEAERYGCPHCSLDFEVREVLREHMKTHEIPIAVPQPIRPFSAPVEKPAPAAEKQQPSPTKQAKRIGFTKIRFEDCKRCDECSCIYLHEKDYEKHMRNFHRRKELRKSKKLKKGCRSCCNHCNCKDDHTAPVTVETERGNKNLFHFNIKDRWSKVVSKSIVEVCNGTKFDEQMTVVKDEPQNDLDLTHLLKKTTESSYFIEGMKVFRWAVRAGPWQPTEAEWTKAASLIQPEEKERIGKFVFKKDAKSSMLGRLLIRKFLVQETGCLNSDLLVERDMHGKPVYPANSSVVFNVSHQGDFAVLAGASGCLPGHQLGIDVMKLEYTGGKDLSEFFRIMTRNFSPKEWTLIKRFPNENEQLKEFCRHWSLKESYVKATGTGITVNLQNLSFHTTALLDPDLIVTDTVLSSSGEKLTEWYFEESLLDAEHCVSLCRNFNVASLEKFEHLSISDLFLGLDPVNSEDTDYTLKFLSKDERP